jgi:hypothetical protein
MVKRGDTVNDLFEEYLREKEPQKREKGYAWNTAIGLQAVDGLNTSDYLIETAKRQIEGDITFEEANKLIHSYYKENVAHGVTDRTEEADKVSVRIAQILSEKSFVFSPAQYISIHSQLFDGIYKHAGKIRDYNIEKEEWVLKGDTVIYASYETIMDSLQYPLASLALAGIKDNEQHLPFELEQAIMQNPQVMQMIQALLSQGSGRGGARPNSGPKGNGATHAANVERTNERNRASNRDVAAFSAQSGQTLKQGGASNAGS